MVPQTSPRKRQREQNVEMPIKMEMEELFAIARADESRAE